MKAGIMNTGKRGKKTFCFGLVICMCVGLMTGCGKKFDAEGYVQACLDALYLRQYGAYAQMLEITEEEAEEHLTEDMRATIQSAFADDTVTSQEDREAYADAVIDVYTLAKYEVVGSHEDGDDYIVTLSVSPSNVFCNMDEQVTAKYDKAVEEKTYDESKWVSYVTEYLREAAGQNVYGDETEIEVHVTKNDTNAYSIQPEDMTAIEKALFPEE